MASASARSARTFSRTTLVAAATGILVMSAASAEARIVCREGYQVVNGREISTPFCNDNYVATIARQYGDRVSDAEVRNNPAKKNEICRWIGTDSRIRNYCDDAAGRGRR
jgi:hypothetical protein